MVEQKEKRLAALCAACRELGAEVRCDQTHGYFTAIVWDSWDKSGQKESALAVQETIRKETAQRDGLVCYCLDPFSTLVYTV